MCDYALVASMENAGVACCGFLIDERVSRVATIPAVAAISTSDDSSSVRLSVAYGDAH